MYDEEGNPVAEKAAAPITLTAEQIFAKFIAKTGGSGEVCCDQGPYHRDEREDPGDGYEDHDHPEGSPQACYQEVAMMGMVQKQVFNGTAGLDLIPDGDQGP